MRCIEVSLTGDTKVYLNTIDFKNGVTFIFRGDYPTDGECHLRIFAEKPYNGENRPDYEKATVYYIKGHSVCRFGDCRKCDNKYCDIKSGHQPEPDSIEECIPREEWVPKIKHGQPGRPHHVVYTVPLHPNCTFGECNGICQVYDCGIRLGYSDAPSSKYECDKYYVDEKGNRID